MSDIEELMRMYRVAKSYYIDNLLQSEIASIENISRSQISKILKSAKENNIVKISIIMPGADNQDELREGLIRKYSLIDAVIAPSDAAGDAKSAQKAFIVSCAAHLEKVLAKSRKVGIGWGNTIYDTSIQFAGINNTDEVQLVPLITNSGSTQRSLQTTSIVDRFAEKFSRAQSIYLNQPLYRKVSEDDSDMIHNIRKMWGQLDVAIVSVGGPSADSMRDRGNVYIDELDIDREPQLEKEMFGDILAHFFLKDGSIYSAPKGYELTAVSLEQLRSIKNVMCLARGLNKVRPLAYAISEGYIKSLVTDAATATALLEYEP